MTITIQDSVCTYHKLIPGTDVTVDYVNAINSIQKSLERTNTVCIFAPTGSGKTGLATTLAKRLCTLVFNSSTDLSKTTKTTDSVLIFDDFNLKNNKHSESIMDTKAKAVLFFNSPFNEEIDNLPPASAKFRLSPRHGLIPLK